MVEEFGRDRSRHEGRRFTFDVALIGGGAAGITLARRLMGSGLRVGLVESGGWSHDDEAARLSGGRNTGLDYYELHHVNLRFFGGTTAVWGGRCAQLDAIDFQRRPWVPGSGWPFGKETLRGAYRDALAFFELPELDEDAAPAARHLENLRAAYWQIDERFDRFGRRNAGDLVASRDVHVVLGATVTRLRADATGGRVASAEIAALNGVRGAVEARVFVVCAGGIESPRLLLASAQPAWPRGPGNGGGHLGRHFMEHPHARGARVFVNDPRAFFATLPRFFERGGARCGTLYRPSEEAQARLGILNTGFTLAVRRHPGSRQEILKEGYHRLRHTLAPTLVNRSLWQTTRRISRTVQRRLERRLTVRKLRRPGYGIYAVLRAEQAPDPRSAVVLSDATDALGVPRADLHWRLSDLDKTSAREAMRLLDSELRRLGLGRAEPEPWLLDDSSPWEFDPLVSNHAYGGYHHMGTTRMAEREKDGVCDPQGRVHGVANLYVAGSSLFPTSGWANPTLTIVALAVRLGDHLKSVLAPTP